MTDRFLFGLLLAAVAFAGCAGLRTSGEFHQGRQAMLRGDNETALSYFRSAAERDPTYTYGTAVRQGIWSYVGRTEYSSGRIKEARTSLEKALATNRDEDVARLYLGLTLARSGERERGLKEIEVGMRGIHSFIDYVTETHRFSFGQYWDPGRELRGAIAGQLATLSRREYDLENLLTDAEWIGKQMEEEIDKARRDESRDQARDSEGKESPGS